MFSSFIVPPDIHCPRLRELMQNGRWKYLFVMLRSRRNSYQYRTAYMRVQEPINMEHAVFQWSLDDAAPTFSYAQMEAGCGLGERPCIRICVYSQGSYTRGERTWYRPSDAFRLLGLRFQTQQLQQKPIISRPWHVVAASRRQQRHIQEEAPAVDVLQMTALGTIGTYSRTVRLGAGGFCTIQLLQLLQGPATVPQQVACKTLRWPAQPADLEREAEVLQLLQPTPSVIGYYGSYHGSLLLEYCSEGDVDCYCANLIRQMEAEEAAANPAAGIARQAKKEAMYKRSMWRAHDLGAACRATGVYPAAEDGACTGGICALWKRWYEEEATEELETTLLLEAPVRGLMRDAFGCLAHLHSGTAIPGSPGLVITHNDLKFSNLLVAAGGSIRLADWGTGHVAGGTVTLAGTLPRPHSTWFAAPEKLTGKASTTTLAKGDVYSLLLTYLGLLVRQGPFFFMRCLSEGKRLAALFSQPDAQARLEWLLDTYYGPLLPPAALAFFKWGLQVDPQQRPSAAEVLAHPYMQSG